MFLIRSIWKFLILFYMIAIIRICWSETAAGAVPIRKFNCSQPPNFSNFDIGKCCRLPALNMVTAIEKCHKQIKSLKSYNDKYPVYTHVCYADCIYRQTNALKADGEINIEHIKQFLTANVEPNDKIIVPTIVNSFQICLDSIKENMQANGIEKFSNLTELGCSPYASMMYSCVNTETFLQCPAEIWQQTDKTCEKAKDFVQQCIPLPHVKIPMF